jgi:pyruvate,water dikinase
LKTRHLYDLHKARRLERIGNKAQGLWFLQRNGYIIPKTYVCTWDAYVRHNQGDFTVLESIRAELAGKLAPGCRFAVRSSANVEDTSTHSFAGQFKTLLDLRGVPEIVQAIDQVWQEAHTPRTSTYWHDVEASTRDLRMAVLVQEMVSPVVSGVSFSKNPVTGMDEIVVEAVRGSGTALVQAGATPERWVNKWGNWTEGEVQGLSQTGGIPLSLIDQVVHNTRAIAKTYGKPVDLEWVWDGETLYWVQLREITALNVDVYSNEISREVFPGLIKPLVWSVNVPLVNSAWVRLFTELIGPNDIDPNDLAKSFYYRAYFNMGTIGRIFEMLGLPRESLELLIGLQPKGREKPSFKPTLKTLTLLPRLLVATIRMLGFARSIEAFLPAARAQYGVLASKVRDPQWIDTMDRLALLRLVDDIYALTQQAAYVNILTLLLMQLYNRLLKGQLEHIGVEFERLDLTRDLRELEQFDPNPHLAALHREYLALDSELQERIRTGGATGLNRIPGIEPFRTSMRRFLEQFGHLSDSGNDFSSIPWREAPDLVLQMVIHYAAPEHTGESRTSFDDLRLPVARRGLLRFLYRRARQFRVYREAVSSLYTCGYGLFRNCFVSLGKRLAEQGLVQAPEDIFYLRLNEIRGLVEGGKAADLELRIAHRKEDMEQCRAVTPPSVVYGDQPPPVQAHVSDRLTGIPTSRGLYRGPVRVVRGIQDLGKVQQGDVLVVAYADVGWTPLFTKAGAIIAESGGILSHSSIVAREYGIPAVVSVPGACALNDGTIVVVDGYRGEIAVQEIEREPVSESEYVLQMV